MSTRIKNPYKLKTSHYHKIFDAIQKTGRTGITRQALLDIGFSPSNVTVVLSPRESSTIGYAGGNRSAKSKDTCMNLPSRKIIAGVKEPQRFVVARRKKPLGARPERVTIDSVKIKSVKAKSKSKSKAKSKSKSKATAKA